MSKRVIPKDLTDKIHLDLQKINISVAYFIVRTDKIFKFNQNDWHVQKHFDISEKTELKIEDYIDTGTEQIIGRNLRFFFYSVTGILAAFQGMHVTPLKHYLFHGRNQSP